MSSVTNNQSRGRSHKEPRISIPHTNLTPKYNHNDNESGRTARVKAARSTNVVGKQPSCDDLETLALNNQKANKCDKLSTMFDTSLENKKPILRVNLIKKSNRPSGVLNLANRRLHLSNSTPDTSKLTDKPENKAKNFPESGSEKSETKTYAKPKINSKIVETTSSSHNSEAKKSQKLIVSLVKDISKTATEEDLDEMLKEIHSAIDEVRKETISLSDGRKSVVNKSGPVKEKQDQLILNSSDVSNSSDIKEVNSYEDKTTSLGNELVDFLKHDKKNLSKPPITGSYDAILSEIDSKDTRTRQRIHRQLMDLSSDDDASKHDLNIRPLSGRLPDRCLRITSSHAKYISPHRKRSLEERLSRAQEAREKFLEYRANKFRDILKKVEEMRAWKEEDQLNLKASVQTKLQKAAVKRKEQLDKIIRKAHDEDSKVSEIQFINNLEAQNRLHDMNSRKREFEARLQDLQDERQRRFEEKQAKEAAAEERRKTLEAERKAKLLEIQQRRKLKNQKVEQQKQVKEKKRIEKNRNREQKITAIKEAYKAGVQTLKKRINQKQEQSELRHEVNLRLIRQKAFELSIKRYNSFISESKAKVNLNASEQNIGLCRQKENLTNDTRRLQLKPFNTKKFCNLCKETICSELALFSHLRSEVHLSSINEHYGNMMLTTNEAVEIHNLRHIKDTDEPLDTEKGTNSDDQQSSRASSLVNYYHSSYLSQANGGISMSESDRDSLVAIEKKCRKLRHKLIVAGKPFNRDWFTSKISSRLAQLIIQHRIARNQSTNTELSSLANTIDLSANNVNCQQNKPFYLKITRINRELISITTDQRISGGGLMPAAIIHTVDRLLADLNKQLSNRKAPQLSPSLLYPSYNSDGQQQTELNADQLAMATKMIEFYAIDTLFLYDIISCLVSILRKIVPNVSLTSKLPTTVASHYSTLIDPISLNSYYCRRLPVLPARIYIKMINMVQSLCNNHSDLSYIIFQSNNMIHLSDILSYRLGFIIGNESPASSISGSSSAATLSAKTNDRKGKQQNVGPLNLYMSKASPTSSVRVDKYVENSKFGKQNNEKQDDDVDEEEDDDEDEDEEDEGEDALGWDRSETYKRTEEIVDDMTAGLCKLLATVTETILSRPLVLLNQLDKSAFDQRSDDFISYMVLVGIVDTESVIMSHIHQQQHHHHHLQYQQQTLSASNNTPATSLSMDKCTLDGSSLPTNSNQTAQMITPIQNATSANLMQPTKTTTTTTVSSTSMMSAQSNNKIINFTTSCIQFVTSLVKLVTAKLPGEEEQKQDSTSLLANNGDKTQLLATLKMTQVSGVLTLVYDMLVHSFNSLAQRPPDGHAHLASEQAGEADSQLSRQLSLALHSLRLINYFAYIDINLLQETLNDDEMLPLQLRHVCSYLISHLVRANYKIKETTISSSLNEQDLVKFNCLDELYSELMNEIVLLLGNFVYLNKDNQLMLKSGRRPTIIEQLIGQLPFDYFARTKLKLVLMPTLISCAYLNEQICAIVCQELSLCMLTAFIEDQLLIAQTNADSKQTQDKLLANSLLNHQLTSTKLDGHLSADLQNPNGSALKSFSKANKRKLANRKHNDLYDKLQSYNEPIKRNYYF